MNEEKIEKKRKNESRIVVQMIELYCRKKHTDLYNITVCDDCKRLMDYARSRIDNCPFMENKTFCANCKVHCYSAEMKKKIREVMRYSGSRMLLYHQVMCIRHAITSFKKVKKCSFIIKF